MTDEQKQALVSVRFEQAMQDAEETFWASIANSYPEIESGDLAPDVVIGLQTAMRKAAVIWITGNRPVGSRATEFIPFGDTIGEQDGD